MPLRRLPLLALVLVAALVAAAPAQASEFTVSTTADAPDANTADGVCKTAANTCTLRAAVQQANALAGADGVTVPAGTYVLASGVTITNSVTITGAGARETIIDGPDDTEAVKLTGGSSTIRGLAVADGAVGVMVLNAEALLDRVWIRDNSPGVFTGQGAGLYIAGASADVEVRRSSVTGNRQLSDGSQAYGAGIVVGNGARLTAVASTIAGNAVGGATAATRATTAIGGGLAVALGSATLRHVTLAGNSVVSDSSSHSGGDVYVFTGAGNAITYSDTLIAGGTAAGAPNNCYTGSVTPTVVGHNLDSGTTCGFGAGGRNDADPLLRPLGAFGGSMDTSPVRAGSPALDAAAACEPGGDQRGAPKAGAACDIGATELSTDVSVTVQSSRTSVAVDGEVTHLFKLTNAGPDTATAVALNVTAPGGQFSIAAPTAGTCTLAVHCQLGDLAPGASATVTVVVRAGSSGPLVTRASSSAATPDANAANGAASASTTVIDKVAPVLGALRLSGKARTKKPIAVTSSLSEAATVMWKLERLTAGRRSGSKCRAGARTGARCTVAKKVGTRSVAGVAGKLALVVPAKFPKRALRTGRYRLTVTARDKAGNASKARTLTLTVKR